MKILHNLNTNDSIVIKNIFGAFSIKGISLLISIFSLPLYIRFFNDDIVLGLWFTLLSILTWLLTFDFGIGNGLRNKLVKAIAKNDTSLVRTYISSSYMLLGIIVLGFILVLTPVIFLINWNLLLKVEENYISSFTLLIVIFINFFTVIIQFFLRLISFILYALQKSAVNNLIALLTTVSQLIFVLLYPARNAEHNLIVLSFVHMICVILPLAVTTFVIFSKKLKFALPRMKYYDFKVGKEILSLGGKFFWIQIMYLVLTGTNAFFIANIFSPDKVVEYTIYYRIFSLTGIVITLTLTPFWSLLTKAKEENDWKWIQKYFRLFSLLSIVVFAINLTTVFILQFLFNVWLGDVSIKVTYSYAILFALFGFIFSIQSFVSIFANGFNRIKTQLIVYTLGVLIKIIILYGFTTVIINWSYIVLVDLIIFIIYIFIEYGLTYKYIRKKITLIQK